MELWFKCEVSQGQFSTEFGITGQQKDGKEFTLFVPREYVEADREPLGNESVPGWLKADLWEQHGEAAVVVLPRQSMEMGRYVTVRTDQLQTKPANQVVP